MKIQVGVMGSAGGKIDEEHLKKAFRLGEAIAKRGCILVNGGCPGLPYEATKGAKNSGGMTVGVSPGATFQEHVEQYKSPVDFSDVMIYTGCGLMGREVTIVRSCEIAIIVGGRSGTLGEFSIAYDEGKLIGVLEGTGGITEVIRELSKVIKKKAGSEIIYDNDPYRLVDNLLEALKVRNGKKL